MKKIFLALFVFATVLTHAQSSIDKVAQLITTKLTEKLGLDSVQQQKILLANTNFIDGIMNMQAGDKQSGGMQRGKELKALKATREKEIEAVLTKEQLKKYEAHKDEMRDKLSTTLGDRMAEHLDGIMQEKLSLTDEQQKKVTAANSVYAKEVADDLLNDDLKGLQKLRSMRDNSKQRNSEMKSILTKEQFKLFQEMQDEMKKQLRDKMKERKNKKTKSNTN